MTISNESKAAFCVTIAIVHLIFCAFSIGQTETVQFLITQTNIWLVGSWVILAGKK